MKKLVLVLVVLLIATTWQVSAVTFDLDIILADTPTGNSSQNVQLNVVDVGKVDVAWASAWRPSVSYSYWEYGSSPVTETIGAEAMDWIGGIGRGDGKIKIGYITGNILYEKSRSISGGAWSAAITNGQTAVQSTRQGSYAVNPTTGYGAFIYHSNIDDDIHYVEDSATGWGSPSKLADAGGSPHPHWFGYPSLKFDSSGTAYIAMSAVQIGGIEKNYLGPLNDLTYNSHPTYSFDAQDIAVQGSNLYNLASNAYGYYLYTKYGTGAWSAAYSIVADNDASGHSDKKFALAVSSTGDVAALIFTQMTGDSYVNTYLATASSSDYSDWTLQRLTGDTVNILGVHRGINPDIAYDSEDNLYVVYGDSGDNTIHLLTTAVPAPATLCLLALGCLGLLLRKIVTTQESEDRIQESE